MSDRSIVMRFNADTSACEFLRPAHNAERSEAGVAGNEEWEWTLERLEAFVFQTHLEAQAAGRLFQSQPPALAVVLGQMEKAKRGIARREYGRVETALASIPQSAPGSKVQSPRVQSPVVAPTRGRTPSEEFARLEKRGLA